MFNFKSYYDLSRDIAANIQKIPRVDIVVGVPKSGVIPACMIASFMNTPYYDIDAFSFAFCPRSGVRKTRGVLLCDSFAVLVVDDSVNTGSEMTRVKSRLEALGIPAKFFYCAVYANSDEPPASVDISLAAVPQPRVFQWNYRNHIIAESASFDMDGVLCVDPTNDQNDDGPKYLEFVRSATPLTIPKKRISAIVTSRLEHYRNETEQWLADNGVLYKDLIMLDLASAEERRQRNIHASFKAEVYKERSDMLFVESNWKQAKEIARLADKPTICTENDALLRGCRHIDMLNRSGELFSYEQISSLEALRLENERLAKRLAGVDSSSKLTWRNAKDVAHQAARSVPSGRCGQESRRKAGALRIALVGVSFNNKVGAGAASSSLRLKEALEAAGVDVFPISMETFPQFKVDSSCQPQKGTNIGYWNSYHDPDHSQRFQDAIKEIEPDVVVLGAVDRGIVSLIDIAMLPYPIVWVVRDNWSHTGGCLFQLADTRPEHYSPNEVLSALSCGKFYRGCDSECPAIKDPSEKIVSKIQFELKKIVYCARPDIVFAPISKWAENAVRTAALTRAHKTIQIYNPIDLSIYKPRKDQQNKLRQEFGLPTEKKLILFGAHKIGNKRKGVDLIYEQLRDEPLSSDIEFVFMGAVDRSAIPDDVASKSHIFGFVESDVEKVKIYNAVDVTLVSALQESLSVVASDSMACGTPVVAFKTSGLQEYIGHKDNGYLATPFDGTDLLRGVRWVLREADAAKLSKRARETAAAYFDRKVNAKQYIDLFRELVSTVDSSNLDQSVAALRDFLISFKPNLKHNPEALSKFASEFNKRFVACREPALRVPRVEEANRLFAKGFYEQALQVYEFLTDQYGLEMYRFNANLCRRRLGRADAADM